MARSKSSGRWLAEHFDDQYVKRAQEEGYRSRAVYKLKEIDDKYRLIRPGQVIVDLGAAPGGWSQYVARRRLSDTTVIALDVLEMEPLPGVDVIEGDFTEDETLQALEAALGQRRVDLVLSDMAPNMTGMRAVDMPRAMYLVELALDFAVNWLKPGGDLLCKVFQGEGSQEWLQMVRQHFAKVRTIKPKASRPRSPEVYVLAQGFKGRD